VLDEAVPNLAVQGRILDRRIGKDQRRRIDQPLGIGRRVGDKIAVAVAVGRVEHPALATLLRQGNSRADDD